MILGLRDGLRSGDIFVAGSRRYADPSTYLYTPAQWAPRQTEFCRVVGKPATADEAIEAGRAELHAALAQLEATLAAAVPDDTGAVRLDEDDNLVIPRLTAEDIPAEARALKDELAGMRGVSSNGTASGASAHHLMACPTPPAAALLVWRGVRQSGVRFPRTRLGSAPVGSVTADGSPAVVCL